MRIGSDELTPREQLARKACDNADAYTTKQKWIVAGLWALLAIGIVAVAILTMPGCGEWTEDIPPTDDTSAEG